MNKSVLFYDRVSEVMEDLCKLSHNNSFNHGFWDLYKLIPSMLNPDPTKGWEATEEIRTQIIATKLALIHSEVSEALEALRKGDHENFQEEIADTFIRLFDLCGGLGITNIGEVILKKSKINEGRPIKHGKAF